MKSDKCSFYVHTDWNGFFKSLRSLTDDFIFAPSHKGSILDTFKEVNPQISRMTRGIFHPCPSSSTWRATSTWRWTSVFPLCWRRTPWGWCWTRPETKAPGSTSSPSTNCAPLATAWVILGVVYWPGDVAAYVFIPCHGIKFMPLMKAANSGASFTILIPNLSIPADWKLSLAQACLN